MSNQQNEVLLEQLFEEALEMGMSEKKAAKYARKKFADLPEPDYKRYGGAVKKMSGGGCVMPGRGGKFKGVS